ncbi:ABC transporter permease [Cellulomonas cellasea]|uniref:Nitrate/sulfonate/bicarbonate ABC transporter permease n=2 Tax=Cellulomonas cellasea TaxID=43670 RepID=A0A0A0BE89_9CELL|nr:ABC transporter permease [Cellulomonas cellasea]KGM03661.1 nitrate/sulfonate/bicarbonate ABC transporter permease [Cellulomonas cellasea DSM 20118]GEA88435.1 ABC transporter permease [Cellulomonas cellasea]
MTIPGSLGTGPVTDDQGRVRAGLNPFSSSPAADEPDPVPGRGRTGAGVALDGGSPARGHRRPALARAWVRAALGAVLPLALLGVWHAVTTAGLVPAYQLPAPASVWTAAVDLAERGQLAQYTAISTQRVLLGFAIGGSLGLLVGALVGLSRVAGALLAPTIGAVRAVPSLAWIPLLILWMKIGEESKITLIAIGAFFPVYTTVAAALRHVDPHLVEVGRAYGLRAVSLFSRVQLPAVLPSMVSGLRLALAQSWLFLVAAELIASSMGLGFLLMDSGNNGRIDRLLLAIVLLAVLGKITDSLLGLAEKHLLRRWS